MICALAMPLATAGCEPQISTPASPSTKTTSGAKPLSKKKKKKKKKKNTKSARPGTALSSSKIEKIICKGHKHCRIKKTSSAGLDANKQPMQVVEITTDSKYTDYIKQTPYDYRDKGHPQTCEPLEYWFVRPTLIHHKTAETQPALLARGCGSFNPEHELRQDEVRVEPGLFSAFLSDAITTVELPSLQIAYRREEGVVQSSHDVTSTVWDWREMAGHNAGIDASCENEMSVEDNRKYDIPNFDYQPIIMTSLPAAFRKNGWKTTALASCSSTVTSLGHKTPKLDTGYVTHGKPGSSQDASFKVVMGSPTELYVEVRDPTLVRKAKNILHTDHLEIWLRDDLLCTKSFKNLFQWGISLDGKVHNFYGKHPKPPKAETRISKLKSGPHIVRFKITIPADYDALTVVYSDSDDGKSQKRLIATSDVKYRDQFSIGAVKRIPSKRGTCQIKNKKLEYTAELQKPSSPVAPKTAEALPPIFLDRRGEYPWSNERIGTLKRGQSTKDIERLLGKPSKKDDDDYSPGTGEYYAYWRYKTEGVTLMFSALEEKDPRTISKISIYPPSKLKTERGIGIGSTRAETEAAYATVIANKKGESDQSNESRVVVGSIFGGLLFYFEEGLVSEIFLGAAAE